MHIRLLRLPPITVRLDLQWMPGAEAGYVAAFFRGSDYWKMSNNFAPRPELERIWADGFEVGTAPWPIAISKALLAAGLAEVVAPAT